MTMAAISCKKLRAGRQLFRRPGAAGGCGGKWPEHRDRMTAVEIVEVLELESLLELR